MIGDTLHTARAHTNKYRYEEVTKMPSALYDTPDVQQYWIVMRGFSKKCKFKHIMINAYVTIFNLVMLVM